MTLPKYFTFFKGRVALYAILKSMGVKEGDEIILPGFTCVVVPNAIKYLNAKPVFVDINRSDYNINTDLIESKINKNTKAIIAQHTFGIPADMDAINNLSNKYNLYTIEDSCHSLYSKYKGKLVGTISDAAFFSSQWSKPITTGLGGWATVNNNLLIEKMTDLYSEFTYPSFIEENILKIQYNVFDRFMTPSIFWTAQSLYRNMSKIGVAVGSSSLDELEYRMPDGYKKKMSKWHSDLLSEKIKSSEKMAEHRKKISSFYTEYFQNKGFHTFNHSQDIQSILLRFPILIGNKDELLSKAKENKIEVGDWFISPLHPNKENLNLVDYQYGSCPVSEDVCSKIINMPTHEKVDLSEAKKIADFVINNSKRENNYADTIS